MSGSGLVQFVIQLVALLAAGGLFFLTVDRIAPDAFFAKVGKIAIGALLIIALIVALAAVFGLGGGAAAISPYGIIYFAVAVIVAVVVLYLVNMVLDYVAANMGAGATWVGPVKYVLGAIVLIALLLVAANTLFGVGFWDSPGRRSQPFRIDYPVVAALSAPATAHL